jgi:MHS family proline/betaine transporter-like MFS transporter
LGSFRVGTVGAMERKVICVRRALSDRGLRSLLFLIDIIAEVFFPPAPEDDENANLIKSFCIFGGAFIARPIGGLMIGYVGDKHGRKTALTRSLFLMAIPTTLMGCLPTYERAGNWAIVLLVLCRIVQGISVGGQLPASLVYTVEKRDPSQWGYYGSLPMVSFCSLQSPHVASLNQGHLISWLY